MKKLEQELDDFRQHLVDMGNLAEKMLRQATDLLMSAKATNSENSLDADEERLDAMQVAVDQDAIRLLTVYSPVAGDLRMVMSIARITAELERIGDHSMNIRESVSLLGEYSPTDLLPALLRMVNIVNGMVNDALNAFSQRDITKAQSTIANDNIVDALNDQIVGDLLHLDVVRKVKGGADMSLPLAQMLIARSLERIADQATNISEEVVYMVKGDDIRHQS